MNNLAEQFGNKIFAIETALSTGLNRLRRTIEVSSVHLSRNPAKEIFDVLMPIQTSLEQLKELKSHVADLQEAVEALVCRQCDNRIGYTGEPTEQYANRYYDWRKCPSCKRIREILNESSNHNA